MKSKFRPLISVLMPVFNAEKYLVEAVDSILHQSYSNFELLIFDDGSTDNSLKIIKSCNDPRIKFFHSAKNIGYVKHLNKGIDIAKGKYIVRMDADDVAYSTRLEEQINFMEKEPSVGVCGTFVEVFGKIAYIARHPIKHEQMIVNLLYFTPIIHPSVIIRKEVLDHYRIRYKQAFLYAEDTELWYQLSKVTRLANIPKVLLKYRTHDHNVSVTKWESNQLGLIKKIRLLQYEALLERQLKKIEKDFIQEELDINPVNLYLISRFFQEIKTTNRKKQLYKSQIFHQFLNERILGLVSGNFQFNRQYFLALMAYPFLYPSTFIQKRIYYRAAEKLLTVFKSFKPLVHDR